MKLRRSFLCLLLALIGASVYTSAQPLVYPETKPVDHVDTYFGVKVPDPYRWLEDDTSSAVAKWVAEENEVTFDYLSKIPFRQQLKARIEKLYDYPKYSAPTRKQNYYVYTKNDGLQNQAVYYIQNGLNAPSEVLIDPNALSPDGTVRLTSLDISKDAKHFVYGISRGGSDWREFFVKELATRKSLPDHIQWAKVTGASWYKDGFFYSAYDKPVDTSKALSTKNENHKVYYHKLGTEQSRDELVYEDPAHPLRFNTVGTTEDERLLILYVSDRGMGKDGNALYVRNLEKGEKGFKPVVTSFDDQFGVIDNLGDKLILQTNRKAQNKRVVLVDPDHPEEANWKVILPEKEEPLEFVRSVGGKLIAGYLKDVTTRVYVYDMNGMFENEIPMPTLGTAGGFGGEKEDSTLFYTFTSFTFPTNIYKYNLRTKSSELFRSSEVSFRPEDFETKQIFYTSNDGTRVPMFIVHKKGLTLNGDNPTLLYGYGGFNVISRPAFSSTLPALLEQGVVYALANIRGGGEYGEKWHHAGTKLNKVNVFEDFIAGAEWLIANNYTSPEKLAVQGGSNGGLLVGAVSNMRPDLFKVALPSVGVMDMLRYQKFTIGWNWKPDYGSSDDSTEFQYIYKYSPLHNIKEGASYPATLATTADHDDRVVPAHSFKYMATLQKKQGGPNPVLIRVDTKSGHGASNTRKLIETLTDVYSFLLYNLGVQPKYQTPN